MRSSPALLMVLCIILVAAAANGSAQSPIANQSFESDMIGWTPYAYSVPYATSAQPLTGCIGPKPCVFDILMPLSTPDGNSVCGLQGWGEAFNGGVYQSFVWNGGPATIALTARAYSEKFDLVPWDNGCRVRMGLASFATDNRDYATDWITFPWSDMWTTRDLTVPGPGEYTLFIEAYQPSANAIMSTLWDNIVFTALPPIMLQQGPTVTPDPVNPDGAVVINWTTDIASTSIVEYGATSSYGQSVQNTTMVTDHSITLTGLNNSSTYHIRVHSTAPDCVEYISDDIVYKTPIQFSDITTKISPDGASIIVSWNTDVPAATQIKYGLTTSYESSTPENSTLTTDHVVTLSGLTEDTDYHFCVLGKNRPLYRDAVSADQPLHTLPLPGNSLRNGGFENGHGTDAHSLYPWVQYTTPTGGGTRAIDGLVGPYPSGGPSSWFASMQAYSGSYFMGAAANCDFKNGGVFQRVRCTPNQLITLTARYATYRVGGINEDNMIRLGIDPNGGVDPYSSDIIWWTGYSPTNDSQWHAAAVTTTTGVNGVVTAFLDIKQQWPIQWHLATIDNVTLETPSPMRIGQLKSSEDGLSAILENEIITYVSPSTTYNGSMECYKIYVEEPNRSAGLCVLLPVGRGDAPALGNRITVTGTLLLIGKEAALLAENWSIDPVTETVPALGMAQSRVGGGTKHQPKLYGDGSVCNVGMRVRIFGKIIDADNYNSPSIPVEAMINDGSKILDPVGLVGTRVSLQGKQDTGVNYGDYIAVTGIVTVQMVNYTGNPGDEIYVYRIITASPDDWSVVTPAGTQPMIASK